MQNGGAAVGTGAAVAAHGGGASDPVVGMPCTAVMLPFSWRPLPEAVGDGRFMAARGRLFGARA